MFCVIFFFLFYKTACQSAGGGVGRANNIGGIFIMIGSKYGDDMRDKARILLASGKTVAEVSKELDILAPTLYKWKAEWKDDPDFIELSKQQKQQEEEKMTDIINKALTRLQSSIDTVQGDKLPTIIGTIYDKRALSRGEATQNQDLVIRVTLKDEH